MKSLKKQWEAPTPKWAAILRNISASISASIVLAMGTVSVTNIEIPTGVKDTIWIALFVTTFLTGLFGTKEKK